LELGVTSPKGEFYPVVHFQAREDAEDWFCCRAKNTDEEKTLVMWRVFKVLAWILVFVVLLAAGIGFMISLRITMSSMSSFMPWRSTCQTGRNPHGVPVTADDVLKAPR